MSADTSQASPEKRLEDMIRLGELCIEVLQQNEEHHSEVQSDSLQHVCLSVYPIYVDVCLSIIHPI